MIQEVRLPEISENVESGDVIQVLVKEGDLIEKDQSIVELETEKAAFEVPSPVKGKIVEINIKQGENIKVGQVIVKVDTEAASEKKQEKSKPETPSPKAEKQEQQSQKQEQVAKETKTSEQKNKPEEKSKEPENIPASPSVRQLARDLGIDISQVEGSGPAGRISAEDVIP